MLLYLVRHGETDLNAQGVYQGHLRTPLNAAGRKQAESLGEHLRGVPFKQCWTSDLPRATETAKIVLGNTHAKTPIQLEPLLTDRAMGMLEGRPWVADQSLVALINGVESDEALAARLHLFLSQLVESHTPVTSPLNSPRTPVSPSDQGSGCVLVVTHDACLLALLQILTETSGTEHTTKVSNQPKKDTWAKDDIKIDVKTADLTGASKAQRRSTLPCVVDTYISADVDVEQLCANTALCVVRVWWEEGLGQGEYMSKGLEAKGRVEVWADVGHLDQ